MGFSQCSFSSPRSQAPWESAHLCGQDREVGVGQGVVAKSTAVLRNPEQGVTEDAGAAASRQRSRPSGVTVTEEAVQAVAPRVAML